MRRIRLGLYDPDPDRREVQWVGGKCLATACNLRDMREAVEEYNSLAAKDGEIVLCLGIFTVEPKQSVA